MYGKKKKKTSISIKRVLLEKGWTQSVISLVMGVRVETKPLMSPRKHEMVPVFMQMFVKYWFSHHIRAIQQHQILSQSLPISFRPGECCRSPSSHLPVSGFVPPKHGDRKGGWLVGGNERESKQASKQVMDNSVFGSYRREGLADLSKVKASWGWLGSGRTPRER